MKNHTHHDHSRYNHGEHICRHRQDEGHHGSKDSERHHGRGGGHRREDNGREGHGPFGGMRGSFGGPRGRARRGEARYILLDALKEGPKHGYEIIKFLEERSSGQYAPSPGTVYPTMQYLEDLGLVHADQDSERRVFHITEAGLADLEAHAQEITDFWERYSADSFAVRPEAGFLRDEMESLFKTVWEGMRGPLNMGDTESIKHVRLALERCRNEVREILSAIQANDKS